MNVSGWVVGTCGLMGTVAAVGQEKTAREGAAPSSEKDLRQRLEEQEKRIAELEARLGAPPAAPAAADAGDKKGLLDLVRWNELAVAGSRFKLYGFLRLDAIYDDSRPNNTQVIAWVRSEDPEAISRFRADPTVFGGVNPERFANRENQDDLTIHPRLTRLGIDFDGPVVRPLGEAKVTGKLEIDFYNNGLLGQAESRAAIRMRHAYLKLAWGGLSLLAGQTSDVISPTFPVVNPDLVMWGAGNLGDRRPQLRPEYIRTLGPGQVILQGEVGLSGADDNQDLDSPNTFGSGIRDGEASGLPTLQGRVAYRLTHAERRDLEVGLWAHRAWEETDTRFDRETHFDSTAYGLDATLPLYRKLLWLKGEGWYGENVDDVRGGIFQGINTTTGDEIISRGGFAEMGFQALSWYQVSIGYSTDDPENSDAGSGGRAANRIAYFSNRWFFDPIEIGLDYLYWKTDFVRFDSGDDNRFQAYISYKF